MVVVFCSCFRGVPLVLNGWDCSGSRDGDSCGGDIRAGFMFIFVCRVCACVCVCVWGGGGDYTGKQYPVDAFEKAV